MSNVVLRRVAVALASVVLAAGCDNDLDPGTRLVDFRLLAVQADKPYAAPGEEVTLRTLAVEPFGRPVSYAWTTCANPIDSNANACLDTIVARARAGVAPVFSQGVGNDSFTTKVPDDALSSLPEQARSGAIFGILTVACPGTIRIGPLESAGPTELPFGCIDANTRAELPYERFAVSVKRIFVRARDRNPNPAVSAVLWDGAPWPEAEIRETVACSNDSNKFDDCPGGETHVVAALPAPDGIDSGTDEYGKPFVEQPVVQFYATEGSFEFEARTFESAGAGTKWVARSKAKGREIVMWFVVRENRGGVGWTSRRVRVKS